MSEAQVDRLERMVEKISSDVADMRQITFHQAEMMKTTRSDISELFEKTNATDKDVAVLKTKASLFGTIGGTIGGTLLGWLMSLVRHGQ